MTRVAQTSGLSWCIVVRAAVHSSAEVVRLHETQTGGDHHHVFDKLVNLRDSIRGGELHSAGCGVGVKRLRADRKATQIGVPPEVTDIRSHVKRRGCRMEVQLQDQPRVGTGGGVAAKRAFIAN